VGLSQSQIEWMAQLSKLVSGPPLPETTGGADNKIGDNRRAKAGTASAKVRVSLVDVDGLKGNPNVRPEAPDLKPPTVPTQRNVPSYGVSARANVTLIDIDDLKGNPNLKPEGPDLQVPKRAQMVKIFDLDKGTEYEVTAEQVRAIKGSDTFIDNYQKLHAQPDWMELTVDKMELFYSGGRKFSVDMKSVNHGLNHSAQFYCLQGGIHYPCDSGKKLSIDAVNTPKVVGGKEYVDKEIARRKQQREEIAWLVYIFGGAVSGLAGAAGGGPKGGGGRMPLTARRTPRSRTPGGTGSTRSGSAKPPATSTARPSAGSSGKPSRSGGVSPKPAGGQPQLGRIKQQKQDAHSYILAERNENQKVKDAASGKGGKEPRELNQRVVKLIKLQEGETPGASLLNRKYSEGSMQSTVGQRVQVELNAGRFKTDRGGGKSMVLDMGEPTGWVLNQSMEGVEVRKLDVRIDTSGGWHFFPTN